MSVPAHSHRETVLDEFLAVAEAGLDDPNRIFEQLNEYSIEAPDILASKPFWCGILLRDHHAPRVVAAMEIRLAHVYRYARRDQLSAGRAFSLAGLHPNVMHIENDQSWFHNWPHAIDRSDRRKCGALAALAPLSARLRLLEQKDAECRAHITQLEQALADQVRQREDQTQQQAEQAQRKQETAAAREACLEGCSSSVSAPCKQRSKKASVIEALCSPSTTWRLLQPLRSLGRRFPLLAPISRHAPIV